MFNLPIEPEILEAFIDLADYEQNDSVAYAEFARIILADNILALKERMTSGFQVEMLSLFLHIYVFIYSYLFIYIHIYIYIYVFVYI